jgi:hypothetical protein
MPNEIGAQTYREELASRYVKPKPKTRKKGSGSRAKKAEPKTAEG